ncbi:MAG: MBOAT family O-acyltransferase [Tepidisphaeraceae bacterium]
MNFNSLHFIAFFAIVVAGFWLLRRRVMARNVFLLLASWYFYDRVTGDIRWLLLLLGTQAFDYTFARLMERYPLGSRQRKWCVVGSCTVNLAVLGFFKYCNFFIDNVIIAGEYAGYHWSRPALNIALPAGISFYTFQSISYVIDVYRGHLKAEKHIVHYALFVAFFPQLIAGPIERATHLLPQVKSKLEPKWDDICQGVWLIWLGLFKKVVLADNVETIANSVLLYHRDVTPTWWEATLGIYAFAIQIYCDFSAYSDMARGAARILGIDLMRNFDLPYFAVNPSDFWRRWHISLSTWLRDYLYIPLGGNRGGLLVRPTRFVQSKFEQFKQTVRRLLRIRPKPVVEPLSPAPVGVLNYERAPLPEKKEGPELGVSLSNYLNLFLTMLIGGLWHGATWLFIMWGIYHGLLLCIHRAFQPLLKKFFTFESRPVLAVWTFVRIVIFFQFTCFGWLLFRADNMDNFKRMLSAFFAYTAPDKPIEMMSRNSVVALVVIAVVLLVGQLVKYFKDDHGVVFRVPMPVRAVLYAGMILAFLIYGKYDGGSFIYFQF